MTTATTDPTALPDPVFDAEFYDDVPLKRFLAWCVDVVLIALISVVLTPFTLFTSIFYFPLFYLVVGFAYRWASLSRLSGTPGMRLMSVELRDMSGRRFDATQALLHTGGFTAQVVMFPAQFISAALILGTARKQSLTDLVMGSAAINRAALD